MRPKITCHMITSLDGRLLPSRWTDPAGGTIAGLIEAHYDRCAAQFDADGWIVGRKTMQDYVGAGDPAPLADHALQRPPHAVRRAGRDLAVAIDPSARLNWTSGEVDGDLAVAVVSQRVADPVLARLRERGVSYVFAGPDGHRLDLALDAIGDTFGVRHLLLEGGGAINGAFLAAGLIDQVSTLVCPTIDGLAGIPAIFEHSGKAGSLPATGQHLKLVSSETLSGGVVWLRHEVVHERP